jgi:hypothetical protein
MSRLLGTLNQGSLLRRTMLHVGTFALGSLTFVALMSALLVTLARTILPPHTAESETPDTAQAAHTPDGAETKKAVAGKTARAKPSRATPEDQEGGKNAD